MDNFVKRRALQEHAVAKGAPVFWSEVSSALRDACDSYREHYTKDVELIPDNGNRIHIVKSAAAGYVSAQVTVIFKAEKREIEVTRADDMLTFYVTADEASPYATESIGGPRLSPDQVCQRILEPVLFPPQGS